MTTTTNTRNTTPPTTHPAIVPASDEEDTTVSTDDEVEGELVAPVCADVEVIESEGTVDDVGDAALTAMQIVEAPEGVQDCVMACEFPDDDPTGLEGPGVGVPWRF